MLILEYKRLETFVWFFDGNFRKLKEEIGIIVQPNCADFTLDSSGAIKVEEATSMEIWNILSFMHL